MKFDDQDALESVASDLSDVRGKLDLAMSVLHGVEGADLGRIRQVLARLEKVAAEVAQVEEAVAGQVAVPAVR